MSSPVDFKSSERIINDLPEAEFIKSEIEGYSSLEKIITYTEIEQRWLVVQSQARKKSDLR
ncbi:hypothetical protein [Nostoc sp.]|uniref:hypothetical protein n=1 Tax=Nostoc sp. TaxID=1180 RepID=UPI002FFBC909